MSPRRKPALAVVPAGADQRQVAAYVALSKDDRKSGRVQHDYDSADAQLDRLRQAAEADGHRRLAVYIERDVSGLAGRGAERARLLADCQAGRIGKLYMTRFDRFTRDIIEALTLPQQLADWGVALVTIEEQGLWDMADRSKDLYRDLKAVLNRNEARASGQRRAEKFRARATLRGLHNGTPPAGYVKLDGQLVADESAAPAVRRVFEAFAEGGCIAYVLDVLREESPVFFGRHRVEEILRNRVYLGEVQYKGEWYAGAHAGLVSVELFEQCQLLLASMKDIGSKFDRYDADVYPLAGYIWCTATRLPPDPYERLLSSSTHKRRKDGSVNKIRAYRRASTEDRPRRAALELLGDDLPRYGGLNANYTERVAVSLIAVIAGDDARWGAVVDWAAAQCSDALATLAERRGRLDQERRDWLEEVDAVDAQLRAARREGGTTGALLRRLDAQLEAAERRLAELEARLADCEQLAGWYAALPGEVAAARPGWQRVVGYYERGLLRPLQAALRNILQQPYGVLVDGDGRITLRTRLSARLDELAQRFAKSEEICILPPFTANLLDQAMRRLAA